MKLKLLRGDYRQHTGPVTKKSYVFSRKVGYNSGTEVDDEDVPGMLNFREGCCSGPKRLVFAKVEE